MRVSALLGAAACLLSGADSATAAAYPDKTVRIVVPLSPGGAVDTVARLLAQQLGSAFGKPVLVDNRPGGSTNTGTEYVARSAPDGYVLLVTNSSAVANATLYPGLAFDIRKDLAPITLIGTTPMMLVVHPSLPAKSVKELIALARRQPGELTYASGGIAGPTHLAGALFASMSATRIVHVPYKSGGQAMTDAISGQVTMAFNGPITALPQLKAGRIRALGVSSARRLSAAPEIPTIAEGGLQGYELVGWFALFAPAGTPRTVIARINTEAVTAFAHPDVRARLAGSGAELVLNQPHEFEEYLKRDIERHARIIRGAGIKAE